MNIALVSMNASPLAALGGREGSGQSVLVDGLARSLGALGHRVTVYVRRDGTGQPARLCAAANVAIAFLTAGPRTPLGATELAGTLEEFGSRLREAWELEPPEAVHAFGWQSAQVAIAAARRDGRAVVQTMHPLSAPAPRHVESDGRALLRAAARVVATSSSQVFALLGLGVSPGAIKLIPCGVDLELFAPASGPSRLPAEPFRLLSLSGLGPAQGIADVIEALPFVDGVEFIIGGGPPAGPQLWADADVARLKELAQVHGVGNRVQFRGRVGHADAAAFLRSADTVVSTPHADAIGTLALEAMACGVPLIVSTVGGLVDAVVDGLTGVHVPPRAPRQLAYAIEAMRADRSRRERFGRLGVERARARYGWPRIAADTLEMYRSVAERNPRVTQSRA